MPTLEWANRNEAVRAAARSPYRVLEYDPALSFGDPENENMLIQGDNLCSSFRNFYQSTEIGTYSSIFL